MSVLKVANVHFEATGTNRVEYVANNINFRMGGGNFTVSVGGAESLNVNASSVMISGANLLQQINTVLNYANNITSTNIAIANITSSLSVHGSASFANTNIASQTLTDGATITWDTSLGQIATITLGGARTLANASNLKVGTYILNVKQNATSGLSTLTWGRGYFFPGNVKPTLTATANARDIITGVSDGTVLYCTYINDVSVS
jgi:hypothetical protein